MVLPLQREEKRFERTQQPKAHQDDDRGPEQEMNPGWWIKHDLHDQDRWGHQDTDKEHDEEGGTIAGICLAEISAAD